MGSALLIAATWHLGMVHPYVSGGSEGSDSVSVYTDTRATMLPFSTASLHLASDHSHPAPSTQNVSDLLRTSSSVSSPHARPQTLVNSKLQFSSSSNQILPRLTGLLDLAQGQAASQEGLNVAVSGIPPSNSSVWRSVDMAGAVLGLAVSESQSILASWFSPEFDYSAPFCTNMGSEVSLV